MSDNSDSSPSIGSTLKEARRRLGLRVKDVAGRTAAKISASYLSCIENDLRLPSEDLLLELSEILGLERRELYLRLVRAKAPADIRGELFDDAAAPEEARYAALKKLTLDELVDRASEAAESRREVLDLRREIGRSRRAARSEGATSSYLQRWQQDASRYRMAIQRTSVDVSIALGGDATVIRDVIGLTPRQGKPALVAIQHTARVPAESGTAAGDDGFKLLEHPADVAVELERKRLGPEQTWFRLVFPEGLAYARGRDRRVSYTFRSLLRGAFSLERRRPERSVDALSDDRGDRGSVVVTVDKPCDELDIVVRFPRFYVADEMSPWAGTQELYESEDNFIDQEVSESWSFETGDDYRARLSVRRPQIGMKFAITWKPLYKDEFEKVRERLELEREETS